eukprot:11159466-Alexandrium_andersonii.AAC.1
MALKFSMVLKFRTLRYVGAPAVPPWPSRPVGECGPPPQRLAGDPSEPPPNGCRTVGGSAPTV